MLATWGLGVGLTFMRFGANSLGFGGWDKGTWGLGVGHMVPKTLMGQLWLVRRAQQTQLFLCSRALKNILC